MNLTSLYKRPTPRQEFINGKFVKHTHGEDEESESWVELFIDLVYVSLLYKLGSLLVSCYNESYIMARVVVLFGNLILTRFAIDEYANRFYSHDLVHKTIYFIYIIGVFVQVLNINTSSHSSDHCVYIPDMSVGIISGIIINKLAIISGSYILQ